MSTVHRIPARAGQVPNPWEAARAVVRRVTEELDVIVDRDPSVRSRGEAVLHPSAVARLGHAVGGLFYRRGRLRCARAVCALGRLVSGGIEIHPGARIGRRFFVDHGCGVVIGETAIVGDDVTVFHQVTLGSTGWWQDRGRGEGARRHPRLGNGVTVGANATLLGPIDVGDGALIGAQSLVLRDVPGHAHVRAPMSETVPSGRPPRRAAGDGVVVVGFPP